MRVWISPSPSTPGRRFSQLTRKRTRPSRGMKGGASGWQTSELWGLDPVIGLSAVDPLPWGSPPKRSVSGSARMLHPDHHHEGGDRGYVGIDAHTRDCHASYAPSADPWTLVPGSSPRRGGNDTSRSLLRIACGAAIAGMGGIGGVYGFPGGSYTIKNGQFRRSMSKTISTTSIVMFAMRGNGDIGVLGPGIGPVHARQGWYSEPKTGIQSRTRRVVDKL